MIRRLPRPPLFPYTTLSRSTFFIVAKELEGWPQLANEPRQEATVAAIGDHTYDHIDLIGATQQQLDHEIVDSQRLILQHSDRKSTRLNSSHSQISSVVLCVE